MNVSEHLQNATVEYCFPDVNVSCRKEVRANSIHPALLVFLSCISVCTVFMNLLVIISISHFKQLHTPTNLLILSLAVADLLVGLFVMPVRIMELKDNCWYLGKTVCALFPVINYISVSASVSSLVFIAVDRYVAVTDPLLYPTKITVYKTSVFIVITWSCSLTYNVIMMYFNHHFLQSQISTQCYGECVLVFKYSWVIADLVLSFLGPCSVILFLYSVILKVAIRQAKAMMNGASKKQRDKQPKYLETKAAKTLAFIVFLYLACWVPFSLGAILSESIVTSSLVLNVVSWFMYINSSVNPFIYAIFYPWFRTSMKYIVTCRMFEVSSSSRNLLPERF